MKDWQTKNGKDVAELTPAEVEKLRLHEYIDLKRMLEGEITDREKAESKSLSTDLNLTAARKVVKSSISIF